MVGYIQREFPRGIVMRGFDPMNPTAVTISLPIHRGYNVDSDIYSGMLISMTADGTEWVKGVPATGANIGLLSFAKDDHDQDDVQEADQLVGLPCSGQFQFATPYFAHFKKPTVGGGDRELCAYTAGTPLTFCKNDEIEDYDDIENGTVVTRTNGRSLAGFIRPAEAGDPVIGVVVQTGYGPYNATDVQSGEIPAGLNRNAIPFAGTYKMPTGVWPLQPSVGSAVDSSSIVNNAYYVVWKSEYRASL